jgi:hypothetical protein
MKTTITTATSTTTDILPEEINIFRIRDQISVKKKPEIKVEEATASGPKLCDLEAQNSYCLSHTIILIKLSRHGGNKNKCFVDKPQEQFTHGK